MTPARRRPTASPHPVRFAPSGAPAPIPRIAHGRPQPTPPGYVSFKTAAACRYQTLGKGMSAGSYPSVHLDVLNVASVSYPMADGTGINQHVRDHLSARWALRGAVHGRCADGIGTHPDERTGRFAACQRAEGRPPRKLQCDRHRPAGQRRAAVRADQRCDAERLGTSALPDDRQAEKAGRSLATRVFVRWS